METLLIYQDDSSNEFWKINVSGSSYTITYGKIGTVGNVKTKDFDSEEKCLKEAGKLIKSKLKKGYTRLRILRADHQEKRHDRRVLLEFT